MRAITQSDYVSYYSQRDRLNNPRSEHTVQILGMDIVVFPGVYATSGDTELIAESAKVTPENRFLELGTGTGAVALYLAKKAKSGTAVDISHVAVHNATFNMERQGIKNLWINQGDLFQGAAGKYDVIVFNPPYSHYYARFDSDRMYWDFCNYAKKRFFEQVTGYLNPGGTVYFGWANFKDIDFELPQKLAKQHGLDITDCFTKPHNKGFDFIVYELKPRNGNGHG